MQASGDQIYMRDSKNKSCDKHVITSQSVRSQEYALFN